MFVNCPFCRGLIATDPATDLPPQRCPRCASMLGGAAAPEAVPTPPVWDARSGVAAAVAEAVGGADDAPTGDPAADRAARPAISIANLLQVPPVTEDEAPGAATAVTEATSPADDAHEAASSSVPAVEPAPVPTPAAGPVPTPTPTPTPTPEAEQAAESEPAPDLPAEEAQVPDAEPGAASEPALETVAAEVPAPTQAPVAPVAPAAVPRRANARTLPSFARTRRTPAADATQERRWPLWAAIGGLFVLLCMQWLLADRARLAADPGWRPVVTRACSLLGCSLPPWREPSAFSLLESDVRPLPGSDDALRVTASFRNDAAWAQAWPEIVLTLSDVDGRPLGARAFAPAEYLGDAPTTREVEPGQGAVIRLDVVEPGQGAVGFSLVFR